MSFLFCADEEEDEGYCNEAVASFNEDISSWDTSGVTTMNSMFLGASSFNRPIGGWRGDEVTDMCNMFEGVYGYDNTLGAWDYLSAFNQPLGEWRIDKVMCMVSMFEGAKAFDQDLGWCVNDGVSLWYAFHGTLCASTSCGVVPCPTKKEDKEEQDAIGVIAGVAALVLLVIGAFYYVHQRKEEDETYITAARRLLFFRICCKDKMEACSVTSLPSDSPAKLPRDEPDEEEATAEKTKVEESVELPSFSKKLTSFLFGEREEAPTEEAPKEEEEAATLPVVAETEEEATEQPPPPPPAKRWFSREETEPAAPRAEEMHQRMAAWYNGPKNAALRSTWGAFPEPDEFQTWPGFVAVTNAFLDASPSNP